MDVDDVERQHTLLTAAVHLPMHEALELPALSEVLTRKAAHGRQPAVRAACSAGASWSQIAQASGVTGQSAWEAHDTSSNGRPGVDDSDHVSGRRAMRRHAPTLLCAGALLLSPGACGDGEGATLVTDGTTRDNAPANASAITLALPAAPAGPHCLTSDGLLVVWPRGSTYDATTGEVHHRDGDLLGRIGETVPGGSAVQENPSSDTLDDVEWAGCTPTDEVLHQYG